MIQAYDRKYNLKLNKDEIAQKAFYVERIILGLKVVSKINMQLVLEDLIIYILKNGEVTVESLKISNSIKCEFEASLIMLYTGI